MQDDLIETVWEQFGLETEDHLEQVEPLLIKAETEALSELEIAELFRSFHSIKGVARLLDLGAMEAVTHAAEDLLGLVRDGTLPLDGRTIGPLVEAFDCIRSLRTLAVAERRDGERPDALVERLRVVAASPGGPPTTKAARSGYVAALHEDAGLLAFYVDLLRAELPSLAGLFDKSGVTPTETLEALELLGNAALELELVRVADLLADVAELATPSTPKPGSRASAAMLGLLTDVTEAVRLIEDEASSSAGSEALEALLSESIAARVRRSLEQLLAAVALLEPANEGAWDAPHVASLAAACHRDLEVLREERGRTLGLLLEECFARLAAGERQAGLGQLGQLVNLARRAAGVMWRLIDDPANEVPRRDAHGLIEQLQRLLRSEGAGLDDGMLESLPETYGISAGLAELLPTDKAREVDDALRGGQLAYEVLAHLESSPELGMRFMRWLGGGELKPMTNRTVIRDERAWFEFLVISPLSPEAFREKLGHVGGTEERYLHMRVCGSDAAPDSAGSRRPPSSIAPPSTANERPTEVHAQTLRVPSEVLDRFMVHIGEMVSVRARLNHTLFDGRASAERTARLRELEAGIAPALRGALSQLAKELDAKDEVHGRLDSIDEQLHDALGRLQQGALELRVVPIDTVFKRLPRSVRDLAQSLGKRVRFEMSGQDVRIDKAMVEVLLDPLVHMVRNSLDHGIELPEEREAAGKPPTASLHLRAHQRGGHVVVEVSDDGRGIPTELVRKRAVERGLVSAAGAERLGDEAVLDFIFAAGFSTAARVTETSGRGVGMDVVKTNVSRAGGSVKVTSRPGRGTVFTLTVPLSAAIQETLLVTASGQSFALPSRYVAEVVDVAASELKEIAGQDAVLLRDEFLPVAPLARLLGMGEPRAAERRTLLVLASDRHKVGLIIDAIGRTQELFVKDVHPELARLPGIGGASTLGDGSVVLILDAEELIGLVQRHGARPTQAVPPPPSRRLASLMSH